MLYTMCMNKRFPHLFVPVFFTFLFAVLALSAQAADPQFLVTWKAQTKVPVWYEGKALAVQNSSVLVSLAMVEQSGKLLNLSGSEIRWYLKGELVQKGTGLTSISVLNKDFSGNYIDLKVSVEYADQQSGRRFIDAYYTIPIVSPKAVVEYKNLQPSYVAGSDLLVKGYPFFFTNSYLKSEWDLGGSQKVQDSYELRIEQAPGGIRSIQFAVWNPSRVLEKAQSTLYLQSN